MYLTPAKTIATIRNISSKFKLLWQFYGVAAHNDRNIQCNHCEKSVQIRSLSKVGMYTEIYGVSHAVHRHTFHAVYGINFHAVYFPI